MTGSANNTPSTPTASPDGEGLYSHDAGAQNGIAGLTAPINSLIGVFLPATMPNSVASGLDFGAIGLNFSQIAPGLSEPFFIGDGLNGSVAQNFTAPSGATRLYLGTMDGYEWNNNAGGFNVTVGTAVPEPSTVIAGALLLLPFGLSTFRSMRKNRN